MPKAQDKSVSAAKANSQQDQANNNNAAASKDSVELINAIKELKADLKGGNEQLEHNIDQLGQEINGKLDNIATEIQNLSQRMDEAESRVGHVESWAEEATEALCTCLEQHRRLQLKLTDLESRSRRNNIRIFRVLEGEEGNSVSQFIEKLLRSQLQLPEDMDLKIQCAHRSLASKPRPEAPLRPIIVNFLEYSIKETILREAWKKGKIQVGSRIIYFDHDYPPEIVKKRKESSTIKRILKDKGIHFKTPFTNMRIHWESGVRTYNCARDACSELKRRGFQVEEPTPAEDGTSAQTRLRELLGWQVSDSRGPAVAQRAKAKLQEFQRDSAEKT